MLSVIDWDLVTIAAEHGGVASSGSSLHLISLRVQRNAIDHPSHALRQVLKHRLTNSTRLFTHHKSFETLHISRHGCDDCHKFAFSLEK